METGSLGFVRHLIQIFIGEYKYFFGVDGSVFPPCSLLFRSYCSIDGRGFHEGRFVVAENIGLRAADVGVDHSGAVRAMTQEKLPDERATTERTEETAVLWP